MSNLARMRMKKSDQEWLRSERDFHDEEASHYEEQNLCGLPYARMRNQGRVETLVASAEKHEHPQFLEVGCGTGFILQPLMERLPNATFYAFDISQQMIQKTRDAVTGCIQQCHLLIGDAMEIPFEDDVFDVVYCVATLHHIPNVTCALAEFRRVLKKGGGLYLEEPLDNQLISFVRKLLRKQEASSPYERTGFYLPSLVREVEYVLTVRNYECFGTISPVAKYLCSSTVVKALWRFDRAFSKLPFSRNDALNTRLWAEKA